MLPSTHTYTHLFENNTPTDGLQLTPSKVLSQERFHIPLAWLARNIAQYGGASNSVLVDPGTIPHFHKSHHQTIVPKSKAFYFQFCFDFTN